jgi:hypothetical protein
LTKFREIPGIPGDLGTLLYTTLPDLAEISPKFARQQKLLTISVCDSVEKRFETFLRACVLASFLFLSQKRISSLFVCLLAFRLAFFDLFFYFLGEFACNSILIDAKKCINVRFLVESVASFSSRCVFHIFVFTISCATYSILNEHGGGCQAGRFLLVGVLS